MCTVVDEAGQCGELPSAEALLAGTLALMTGHAQQPDSGLRTLMARKIVSNLLSLSGHPHLSGGFQRTVTNLRASWQAQLGGMAPEITVVPTQLWHGAHAVVQ